MIPKVERTSSLRHIEEAKLCAERVSDSAHFPIVMSKGATSTLASLCCIVSYGGKHIVD